jgi:signal transduction histidine kinase
VARVRREASPDTPVIELGLDEDSLERLPEAAEICLFRAAQEGLRNALKHAGAQHVRISLRLEGDEAVLRVRDDGRGFQVPARLNALAKKDHFGLLGVAERAAWTGGELTVRSRPGDGTELVLRVPMEEPREKSGTSQTG